MGRDRKGEGHSTPATDNRSFSELLNDQGWLGTVDRRNAEAAWLQHAQVETDAVGDRTAAELLDDPDWRAQQQLWWMQMRQRWAEHNPAWTRDNLRREAERAALLKRCLPLIEYVEDTGIDPLEIIRGYEENLRKYEQERRGRGRPPKPHMAAVHWATVALLSGYGLEGDDLNRAIMSVAQCYESQVETWKKGARNFAKLNRGSHIEFLKAMEVEHEAIDRAVNYEVPLPPDY